MGIFDRFKKTNAIQVNDIGVNTYSYTPYLFPFKKGDKPLGNFFLQSCLNILWNGISNISYTQTGKEMLTPSEICEFIEKNSTLLISQYLRLGYIVVFYDKNKNYRVPMDSELRTDGNGKIINKFAIVIYSPQYQTERLSLLKIALPVIASINKMAGTEDYLTETLGCFGILSGQEIPGTPKLKEQMLQQFSEKYGIGEGKYKFLLTNKDITYTEIKPNIAGLKFQEKIKECYKYLANLFGIPLPLIFDDASTYNNVKEARTFFYNNTVRFYAEILLKVARELLTASAEFIPQSAITYRLENCQDLEKTLSYACEERTALLNYLVALKNAGVDTQKQIEDLFNESKDLLRRV